MVDNKKIGKQNREAGARFERKVRKDLESKGWIVDKWSNNVEFEKIAQEILLSPINSKGKLIPAKHKFRGKGIPMAIGTGFPDFIAFTKEKEWKCFVDEYKIRYTNRKLDKDQASFQVVIGVEAKSNGYLNKEEKEKCRWLLDNNVFSKILIAKKGKKRGEVEYNETN